jgi:hypothetical protein
VRNLRRRVSRNVGRRLGAAIRRHCRGRARLRGGARLAWRIQPNDRQITIAFRPIEHIANLLLVLRPFELDAPGQIARLHIQLTERRQRVERGTRRNRSKVRELAQDAQRVIATRKQLFVRLE